MKGRHQELEGRAASAESPEQSKNYPSLRLLRPPLSLVAEPKWVWEHPHSTPPLPSPPLLPPQPTPVQVLELRPQAGGGPRKTAKPAPGPYLYSPDSSCLRFQRIFGK